MKQGDIAFFFIHTLSLEERSGIGDEVDGDPVSMLFLGDDNCLYDGPASTA